MVLCKKASIKFTNHHKQFTKVCKLLKNTIRIHGHKVVYKLHSNYNTPLYSLVNKVPRSNVHKQIFANCLQRFVNKSSQSLLCKVCELVTNLCKVYYGLGSKKALHYNVIACGQTKACLLSSQPK